MLEEEATLLEGAERSQVTEFKCKKIAARDEKEQQPSKKAKEKQQRKYCGGATIKMGGANPYERCMNTRQDCLTHYSR